MNFQQLRIIREATKNDFNLSDVAESLYTSQSGVSRHIKELETELGLDIFIRKRKRLLGLTDPGKSLLSMAERILNEAENISHLANAFANNGSGQFHIATTHTQARYVLPGIIKEFRVLYPNVQLVLHQGSPSEITTMLLNGETDIGIASELLHQDLEIAVFPYYKWNHVIIVPRGHPLSEYPEVTIRDLAAWPLITYQTGLTGRAKVDAAFEREHLKPEIVLSAQDSDVIKTYVELGLGVGILAEHSYDSIRDSNLIKIPATHLFSSNTVWFGMKKNKLQPNFSWHFLQLCNPAFAMEELQRLVYNPENDTDLGFYEI